MLVTLTVVEYSPATVNISKAVSSLYILPPSTLISILASTALSKVTVFGVEADRVISLPDNGTTTLPGRATVAKPPIELISIPVSNELSTVIEIGALQLSCPRKSVNLTL